MNAAQAKVASAAHACCTALAGRDVFITSRHYNTDLRDGFDDLA
ncbi:MAG: hypothetical protein M0Z43_03360 [Acidithiobacillus sp.]|nr:hypothetical protein [Acidithiobacillus sp.]